jgi:hypothetical protein
MVMHWILWILLSLACFTFVIRFLPKTLHIISLSVLSVALFAEFIAAVVTMTIDTTDENVKKSKMPRNIEYVKVSGIPVIDHTNYCHICQVTVQEGTKHCKVLSLHYKFIN